MTIEVKDLTFLYPAAPIFKNISFSIPAQEFIGIFGPNGGGKTTLLKILLGLIHPSHGSVLINGLSPQKARRLIGYVPQTIRSDQHFPISTLDVVLMGCLQSLKWFGIFPESARTSAIRALERVGLAHKAHAPFGTLSGGEAQRAVIARAIAHCPKYLFLDEPTANIDAQAEKDLYDLLAELSCDMTILMVSHDLHTIIHRASRLLYVHRRVTFLDKQEICEHFALGLYHSPLSIEHEHFAL
jgi:zinc transport system ATP-binding protein